jgi:signal transduction histidine kinase
VRFGLAYAILFGFSTIAVVALVWRLTAGDVDRQTADDIQKDWVELLNAYNDGGLAGLEQGITRLLDNDMEADALYLVFNPSLRLLYGSLPEWPPELDEDGPVRNVELHLGRLTLQAELMTATLPDGSHLLIGRDVERNALLWRKLANAVPWTVAIMAVLGVFGGVTVRRLFVSMLADVSKTTAAISAGDLSSRVPVTGQHDEFDELAETINEMLDRISRLMDGVRGVSNAIAHDLRTPITRARARLEDAARDCTTEAELRAAVERAIADLDGVVSVFHALLRIAEIEAGSRRSAFAAFDVVPLLRDLAELYEPAAEAAGQTLELDLPDTLMTFGDRDMMQQAVANLLDNAVKFAPGQTAVRVAATRATAGQPAMIVVSDRGPGIPEADRARATERFFRGEAARNAPGSGLGLALVQAVAVLHGGTLRLEDGAPGLRASITLPGPAPAPFMENVSRAPHGEAIPHDA